MESKGADAPDTHLLIIIPEGGGSSGDYEIRLSV
jgi:hypothetical protein